MRYRLAQFLGGNRAGRKLVTIIHRWPVHPGAGRRPLRFDQYGCWLCRLMTGPLIKAMAERDPFADQSSIHVSDPVYDADGNLLRHGVTMSATAKRQLDSLMADPEQAEAIKKVIDDIARDPNP